jgi:phosphoglycerate-specific signal transduction histidine kinase
MSKTPRTDEQELAYVAEDGSTYVHTTFARKLEREIRQLEVAIYDGKKEAGVLRQMLAELHEVNAELHKDAQRLDWILSDAGNYWLSLREDIDREMK